MIELLATWLEQTPLAQLVAQSLMLTASLSAAHALGFTIVMGSALIANLRLLGLVLSGRPMLEVIRPASIGIILGLLISITTGVLLFATRATSLIVAGTFQLKMTLLATAAVVHLINYSRVTGAKADSARLPVSGSIGLALWLGLALAACALILLE